MQQSLNHPYPAQYLHHPAQQMYYSHAAVPPGHAHVNYGHGAVGYPGNPCWAQGTAHQPQPPATGTSTACPITPLPWTTQFPPPRAALTSTICVKAEPDTDKAGPRPPPPPERVPAAEGLTFPIRGSQDAPASTALTVMPVSGPSPAKSGSKRRIIRQPDVPLPAKVEEEPSAPFHRDAKEEEKRPSVPSHQVVKEEEEEGEAAADVHPLTHEQNVTG